MHDRGRAGRLEVDAGFLEGNGRLRIHLGASWSRRVVDDRGELVRFEMGWQRAQTKSDAFKACWGAGAVYCTIQSRYDTGWSLQVRQNFCRPRGAQLLIPAALQAGGGLCFYFSWCWVFSDQSQHTTEHHIVTTCRRLNHGKPSQHTEALWHPSNVRLGLYLATVPLGQGTGHRDSGSSK